MAWNQPGNNGDRDPWGQRNGQQGPPDLDEVLGKMRSRLSGVFGGGGGGGSGSRPAGGGGLGTAGVGVIVGVLVLAWGFAGVYIVEPAEEAVVTRFGKYNRIEGPGPHWRPYFIEDAEKVNVAKVRSADIGFRAVSNESSVEDESLMLTKDENIVDLQFAVQYRVSSSRDYLFEVRDPNLTLRQATESAVREIVGNQTMDFVLTEGRNAVAVEARSKIQEILERYQTGLQVMTVNMQRAQPPAPVQEAFDDAVQAREDEERTKNVARAYAADILPKAEGEANAIREQALAYKERVVAESDGETSRFLRVLNEYKKAPEVTRQRIYLEAVESVLSNTNKVMIDVEGGNNLTYLPLDRIMQPRANSAVEAVVSDVPTTVAGVEAALDELKRKRNELRSRSR
ncbi:MAG: FtsH protease activity modulator HflK [Gammaproteobacteria bacterium]|nr:FtsH protease activity modulator HflK [Gammaproteobacteria bacterium]